MPINLGDINFGLGADTKRLQEARRQILAFGQAVESAANDQADGARRVEAAMRKQEAAVLSSLQKILDLNNSVRKVSQSDAYIAQTTSAFNNLVQAIARGPVEVIDFQRAMSAFNAEIKSTSRSLDATDSAVSRFIARIKSQENSLFKAEQAVVRYQASVSKLQAGDQGNLGARAAAALETYRRELLAAAGDSLRAQQATQNFQKALQGLNIELGNLRKNTRSNELNAMESSLRRLADVSILLSGPLSGIATRLTLIAAVAEHVNANTAAMVVGVAAATAAMVTLGKGAVSATREFQKSEQALISLYGNTAVAADKLDYLRGVANRAGADFFVVAKAFTRLEAASQGTSLQGEKTTKIFENILFASQKLGASQEELGGTLKAVEQIMSKGQVQAEELRGQLGDRLPGAINIMAEALGVSTMELNRMMKQGELTSDVLEAFAETAVKRLGVDVTKAIDNTVAAEARFANALTFFNLNVDKAVGFTAAYVKVLETGTGALNFFGENIENTIRIFGALAGASTAAMLAIYGPQVLAGFGAVLTMISKVTKAVFALNVAAASNPFGAFAAIVTRVVTLIAGAAIGFGIMNAALADTGSAYKVAADGIEEFIAAEEAKARTVPEQNAKLIESQKDVVKGLEDQVTAAKAAYDEILKRNTELLALYKVTPTTDLNKTNGLGSNRAGLEAVQQQIKDAAAAYQAAVDAYTKAKDILQKAIGVDAAQTAAAAAAQGNAAILWSERLGEIRTKMQDVLTMSQLQLRFGKDSIEYARAQADQELRIVTAKALQEGATEAQILALQTLFELNKATTDQIERQAELKKAASLVTDLSTELEIQKAILRTGEGSLTVIRMQQEAERDKLEEQLKGLKASEDQTAEALKLFDAISKAEQANALFAANAGNAIGAFSQILGIVQNIAGVLGSIGLNTAGLKAQAEALGAGLTPSEATVKGKVATKAAELAPALQSENILLRGAANIALKAYNKSLEEEAYWQEQVNERTKAYNEANKSSGGGGAKTRNTLDDALDSLRAIDEQLAIAKLPAWQRGVAERQAEINVAVDAFKDKLTRANIPQERAAQLVQEYTEKLTALREAEAGITNQIHMWDVLSETLSSGMDQALDSYLDAIFAGEDALKALLDVGKSVAQDLLKTFMQLAWLNPLKNWLFGGDVTTGQAFPTLANAGGLLGGLFGGGMASGGPLNTGKWYIAGEQGPEPIWGGGAGAFASGYGNNMPASMTAGGYDGGKIPKVYVNVATQPGESVQQSSEESGDGMTQMQSFIIQTVNGAAADGRLNKGMSAGFGITPRAKTR